MNEMAVSYSDLVKLPEPSRAKIISKGATEGKLW
jgi:hypothetical protein